MSDNNVLLSDIIGITMASITGKIVRRIRAKKRGWVFTPCAFMDIAPRALTDKVISRLVAKGMIRRLTRGIYDFPKQNKLIGTLSPDADSIVSAIAAKTGKKVCPSGAAAANMLGLSTQVPARPTFVTNGKHLRLHAGNQLICINHAHTPIIEDGPLSANLVIQALSYLGKKNIDDGIIYKCSKVLQSEYKARLTHMAAKANIPSWIIDIMHKIQYRYHA